MARALSKARGLEADQPHILDNVYGRAKGFGYLLEPFQRLACYVPLRQDRSAALRDRASKAHINRIEGDFFEGVGLIGAHGDHTAPEDGVSGEATFTTV